MKKSLAIMMTVVAVAAVHLTPAGARSIFIVPGSADPFLAGGGSDDLNPGSGNQDTSPSQAPVSFGSVIAGSTIVWSAYGNTGNTPSPGFDGPNGTGSISFEATLTGSSFNQPNFSAPLNSLVGVFTGNNGFNDFFFMGSSGSIVVPAGATELYMGSMDGYQWNNNSGEFYVTASAVPETTTIISGAMLLLPLGASAARKLRTKVLGA